MAGEITLGQLRVKCRFRLLTVLGCGIHAVYGEHTRAEVSGVVKRDEAEPLLADITENGMTVSAVKGDGSGGTVEEILFAGSLTAAELTEEGGHTVLSLRALSNTWKMDTGKKSRSFQDMSLTYREVAEEIVREYGGKLVWNMPDRKLEYPLVQYRETDYAFLRRLLSCLGGGIAAVDTSAGTCLRAGIGNTGDGGYMYRQESTGTEPEAGEHGYGIVPFRGRQEDRLQEGRMRGCRIADAGFRHVGDAVRVTGKVFYVMEARTVSRGGVLECVCHVFPGQCFGTERIPAESLRGVMLEGEVLETEGEKVKLRLDIDRVQPVSGAYAFPWEPITGNLAYCMPETGTRVALYFPRAGEQGAAVVRSVRENGERCGETADYNDRYFTTDGGRRMYLKPSEMGFAGMPERNAEVALKDGSVLDMRTVNCLSLLAEGQVQMKGRTVTLSTPKEATLVRKDLLSPTVINMCNAFDAIGKKGNFAAAPQVAEKKRRKSPPLQTVEEYPVDGLAEVILSNIPAADLGGGDMEAVAGCMPVISRLGNRK